MKLIDLKYTNITGTEISAVNENGNTVSLRNDGTNSWYCDEYVKAVNGEHGEVIPYSEPENIISTDIIRKIAAMRIASLTAEYTREERDTWPIQVSEAKTYLQTGSPEDANFLARLATGYGLSLDDFALLVLEKHKKLNDAVSGILAKQREYLTSDVINVDLDMDKSWKL